MVNFTVEQLQLLRCLKRIVYFIEFRIWMITQRDFDSTVYPIRIKNTKTLVNAIQKSVARLITDFTVRYAIV